MQYLDNDMDELFRKAADKYPLRTDIKKWDNTAPVLPVTTITAPAGKNKWKTIGLLLLPFIFIVSTLFLIFIKQRPNISHSYKKTIIISHSPSSITIAGNTPARISYRVIQTGKSQLNTIAPGLNGKRNLIKQYQFSASRKEFSADIVNNKNTKIIATSISSHTFHTFLINTSAIAPAGFHKKNMLINSSLQEPAAGAAEMTAKRLTEKRNGTRWYAGLEAGLQFNEAKGQGFNKPGFSAGLLAGYRLNKKLSVEAGIAYSKKYFFTEGKYFNMAKADPSMPLNMTMISINSSNNIFEIPVVLKYNLPHTKSSNWFLTAGLSSYLLTKESNSYLALINGQQQKLQGKYTQHKGYFSASAEFSMGYECNTAKQFNIRIEPYIQIPLKGVGIGEVQLMTAGFHLGITKHLHQ